MLKTKQKLPTIRQILSRKQAPVMAGLKLKPKEVLVLNDGQDPWVTRQNQAYYSCRVDSHAKEIIIEKGSTIKSLRHPQLVQIWKPHNHRYGSNLWAPELHHIGKRWYIYFAADDGNNAHHRMYVLESVRDDPESPYHLKGVVSPPTKRWQIDGTILEHNGSLYFIWSGWENFDNTRQNLYIAHMSNPWTIDSDRVCISKPDYNWEGAVNEGPEILKHNNKIYLIYSANASFTDDYCLGQLSLVASNPMNPLSWRKRSSPVFHKNQHTFGPGHASFTTSLHERRNWIIYHTAKHSHAGWNREIHAKTFTWNKDGSPRFGIAI